MSQEKRRKYTAEFKAEAVARMKHCQSVVGLARELGICWSLLYTWRDRLPSKATSKGGGEQKQAVAAEKELSALRAALATKTLEADFFRGALQKIETRRQRPGGVAFTTKSGM